MKKVIIYADGSCFGNPGPGGWAAIVQHKDTEEKVELSGGRTETTNNQMEIQAVLSAVQSLEEPCEIDIYTDSQYVVNTFEKHWIDSWKRYNWTRRGEELKNREMWMELDRELQQHRFKFHWVKGHAGNPLNERCDQLAVEQSRKYANQLKDEPVSEGDSHYRQANARDAICQAAKHEPLGYRALMALNDLLINKQVEEHGIPTPCGGCDYCEFCGEYGAYAPKTKCAAAYIAFLDAAEGEN